MGTEVMALHDSSQLHSLLPTSRLQRETMLAAQRGGLAGLVMAESGVPYSLALMTTLIKREVVRFSLTGARFVTW